MDRNVEKPIITDDEFAKKLEQAIDFLAQVAIHSGIWEVKDYFFEVQAELDRRGMQPLGFTEDSRVADRIRQIEQEKVQARENDPEGYEAARRRYTELLQEHLERDYKQELGEVDASKTEENSSIGEALDVAAKALYKYEPRIRDWWNELRTLKRSVMDRKQEIIDKLSDDERMALEIQNQINTLTTVMETNDSLRFEARWHTGDIENNGYMGDSYSADVTNNAQRIQNLQKQQRELPTVKMSDILRKAIFDVKVSMEDYQEAKTPQSRAVEKEYKGESK